MWKSLTLLPRFLHPWPLPLLLSVIPPFHFHPISQSSARCSVVPVTACPSSSARVCESPAGGVSFALKSPVTGSIAWTESDSDRTPNLRNQRLSELTPAGSLVPPPRVGGISQVTAFKLLTWHLTQLCRMLNCVDLDSWVVMCEQRSARDP